MTFRCVDPESAWIADQELAAVLLEVERELWRLLNEARLTLEERDRIRRLRTRVALTRAEL